MSRFKNFGKNQVECEQAGCVVIKQIPPCMQKTTIIETKTQCQGVLVILLYKTCFNKFRSVIIKTKLN